MQGAIIATNLLLVPNPAERAFRFVKISQTELSSILRLYEGVMSYACHGLFFREGEALADQLAELCKGPEDMIAGARKILIARGWIEDATIGFSEVRVKGSVEVITGSELATCHRLRGILSRLYTIKEKKSIRFAEIACQSTGSQECVFKPEVS